jgi:hypothetical protein
MQTMKTYVSISRKHVGKRVELQHTWMKTSVDGRVSGKSNMTQMAANSTSKGVASDLVSNPKIAFNTLYSSVITAPAATEKRDERIRSRGGCTGGRRRTFSDVQEYICSF